MFGVRIPTIMDIDEILRIEAECGERIWTKKELKEYITNSEHFSYIAVDEGDHVIGFATYKLGVGMLTIISISVDSDCWRSGVGRTLVNKIKDRCVPRSKYPKDKVEVYVPEQNLRAQLFFKALRFFATDVIEDYFDDGQAAYRMLWRKP